MISKPLRGKVIVNTRPKHQAHTLTTMIEDLGGHCIEFPTLEIIEIPNSSDTPDDSIAIFVSANAVLFSKDKAKLATFSDIIAIGPGTQKACEIAGLTVTQTPSDFNSEGVLALESLQNVSNKNIVLFCGENAKPLMKKTLTARGANVIEFICYKAICPNASISALQQLSEHKIDIIISSSLASLKNLYELLQSQHSDWLKQTPLLVISQDMQDYAKQQKHLAPIYLAKNASQSAIIDRLIQIN